jgi:hypothetical protein
MIADTSLPPTSGEPAISLRLGRDNPCNTSIVDPDGNVLYAVATDFSNPSKPVTRVHDGIGKLIAEWIWRDARSDLLTIRDHPQTPASAWLKKSFIPFREYVFLFLSFFFLFFSIFFFSFSIYCSLSRIVISVM